MKIHYLWHSEFIVTLKNNIWEDVTIMSDSWISDYAVSDMMSRNPTFKIDYSKIPKIDWLFLSHSHMDHIDPYSLIELFSNFKEKPVIFLPETVSFLKNTLEQNLNTKVIILRNKEEISFKWINLRGFVFENGFVTNEDDVMGLFVSNEKEIIFTEVDLVPPEKDEVHDYLYKVFNEKKYETVLYLATRNELEWNLKMLDIENVWERKKFEREYLEYRKEEIEYEYLKFYEWYVEYNDIKKTKNFMKIFIGQWICYPPKFDSNFAKLWIMSLTENVRLEKEFAKKYFYNFPVSLFEAGKTYEISKAKIISEKPMDFLSNFSFLKAEKDLNVKVNRFYIKWPFSKEKRDLEKQEKIIINILNNKFLPYRFALWEDNLKNAVLNKKEKNYIIKVIYADNIEKYYIYDFSKIKFELLEENSGVKINYDEIYFSNDLEDFLNWKIELYSNFLQKLEKWKNYRVWTMLWADFINNDILLNKFNLHFALAKAWKTSNEYVEEFYKN